MRACKPLIHRQQGRIECLSQCHVERVPSSHRIPQLPRTLQQPPVPETLARPIAQIRDRPAPQPCRPTGPAGTGHGQPPSPQRRSHAAPRDRRLRPDAPRSRPQGACPQQPRTSTTRQRPAFGHSPRHSSNVSSTSAVDTSEGRRPVRASHCATEGRAANRAASRRSSSGTVIPSSAARRTNAAYMSSSMSRI